MKIRKIYQQICVMLYCVVICYQPITAQDNEVKLKFGKDKTFKIAQFTDIHWDNNSNKCNKTIKTIEHVLETEKPDLVILTGDIVTTVPVVEGWKAVTRPFIEAQVPWGVTLGNHDAEPGITRDEIFELLQPLPFFVGSKGPVLTGCGNYSLIIEASESLESAAVIYCFDSNSYTINKKHGKYDWIHFDQIEWYRNTSEELTAVNNNVPLPALAFFHIPIPEFEHIIGKETTIGEQFEGVASAQVNSGLFASMLEMKDVMGIFVGHDHDNNYIGIHQDIAMGFGQVTGVDAYGDFDRGGRIIEIKEDEYSFDTWISTKKGTKFKYNYPSGISTDVKNIHFYPATEVSGLKQGVAYNYFEGDFKSTEEIKKSKSIKSGFLNSISIEPAELDDYFAFEYTAFLKISKKGIYRFYTYSDDGSRLYINGELVVDNDGGHSARRKDGSIALDEGYHEFKLYYFESYMGNELEVGISGLNIRETKIPDQMLFIKE